MFKAPFSFKGRIRRSEYGLSYIIYLATLYFIDFVTQEFGDVGETINLILIIPMLWFYIAQGAKRCHDRGNSGFYQIIPFYVFWMIFAESDFGKNKYGLNPKGEGNPDDLDQMGITLE